MAEVSHNPEHDVTGGRHALGEIYPRRKGRNVKVYLSPGANYAVKPTSRSDTGEQELGVKFTHLVFHRNYQRGFRIHDTLDLLLVSFLALPYALIRKI
jgi:hypothetical protein